MLHAQRAAMRPAATTTSTHVRPAALPVPVRGLRARQLVIKSAYQPNSGYQASQQSYGSQSQQSTYYPEVPAYTPVEPTAPPLPAGTPTYTPSTASDYSSTSYAPSVVLSEAEQLAVEDLEVLRGQAGQTRFLSTVAFWIQFALSVVSAGILLFSAAFVPKAPGLSVNDITKWMTVVGVAAAFISSLFAHGFLRLSKKLQDGGNVARGYLVGTLLTNNAMCLAGIAVTVIGLQASVGNLVAKSLMTAMSGPYQYNTAGGLVSLDVFALQASTNTLLCHVVGLLFTNLMLRLVNKK